MAPFVAIALRDREVMKVQRQHMAVRRSVSPIPAMPTILGTKSQEHRINRLTSDNEELCRKAKSAGCRAKTDKVTGSFDQQARDTRMTEMTREQKWRATNERD
jgi:hypothetical protein